MLPGTSKAYAPLADCLAQRLRRAENRLSKLEAEYLDIGKSFFALPPHYLDLFTSLGPTGNADNASILQPAIRIHNQEDPEICRFLSNLRTTRDEVRQALRINHLLSAEAMLEVLEGQEEELDRQMITVASKLVEWHSTITNEYVPESVNLSQLNETHMAQFRDWLSRLPDVRKALELGSATLDQIVLEAIYTEEDSMLFDDGEETLCPPTPVEGLSPLLGPTAFPPPPIARNNTVADTIDNFINVAQALNRSEGRRLEDPTLIAPWNIEQQSPGSSPGSRPRSDGTESVVEPLCYDGIDDMAEEEDGYFPFADALASIERERSGIHEAMRDRSAEDIVRYEASMRVGNPIEAIELRERIIEGFEWPPGMAPRPNAFPPAWGFR